MPRLWEFSLLLSSLILATRLGFDLLLELIASLNAPVSTSPSKREFEPVKYDLDTT